MGPQHRDYDGARRHRSTPMLLKTVQSHRIDPKQLITHRFKLDKIIDAYEIFGAAAKTNALKVLIEA